MEPVTISEVSPRDGSQAIPAGSIIVRQRGTRFHAGTNVGIGTAAPGTKLDNELELASRLRIARVTVRSALQHLVEAGLVVRTPGSGTHVTPPHRWARPPAHSTSQQSL